MLSKFLDKRKKIKEAGRASGNVCTSLIIVLGSKPTHNLASKSEQPVIACCINEEGVLFTECRHNAFF